MKYYFWFYQILNYIQMQKKTNVCSNDQSKKRVHLFSGNGFYSSEFIKELKNEFEEIKKQEDIEDDEFDEASRVCPTHKVKLQKRRGYRGPFYGCPKYFSSRKM